MDPDRNIAASGPWLRRKDWAEGRIASAGKSALTGAWILALVWNVISSCVLVAFLLGKLNEFGRLRLVFLLFPAIGVGLLAHAALNTVRWMKFGQSWFKMQSVPGVVGGQLSGAIQTSVKIRPEDGFHLKLRCINFITSGHGKNASTTEHVLWEDEKTLVKELLADDPRRSGIPVFFQIPAESLPSDHSNPRDQIVWRLDARARVPGVAYSAQFEVPVFVVAGAAVTAPVADPSLACERPAEPNKLAPGSRIKVRPLPSGETEFVFPALRNPANSLAFGLVVAIFSGVTWWLSTARQPDMFFLLVFGVTSLVMWLAWFNLLFRSSRAVVDANGIGVFTHWLFLRTGKRLAAADVSTVAAQIGMTSGRPGAETVYYKICVTPRAGNDITVATGLKDHAEAKWLAAEMQRLLKLDKRPSAPTIGA